MRSEMTATTRNVAQRRMFPYLASRRDSPAGHSRRGTPRQLAHRKGVRAVRGERAVPGSDAERSERGGWCLRATSTRGIQRPARHAANRLPTRRSAARGATHSSRRSVRTRSCDPRRVRLRFLAPQSLRGPVPSAVWRITKPNRRTRKDACRIGIAASGSVLDCEGAALPSGSSPAQRTTKRLSVGARRPVTSRATSRRPRCMSAVATSS